MKSTTTASRAIPLVLFTILAIAMAAGCAGNRPETGSTQEMMDVSDLGLDANALPDSMGEMTGYSSRIYRDGRVYISGQPDQDALRSLPGHEITAVINLRTAKEMGDTSKVDFDEVALVDSLGLGYIEIPLGGKDNPYTPAAVDAFAAALDQYTGPVLLHCASGGRASHLWAAYLVRHRGWDVSTAYARGEAIGIHRSAFSRLLDREMKVVEENP